MLARLGKPLAVAALLLILPAVPVLAGYGPRVYVDGRRLPLDAPVLLVEGRAMVPARAVFEALGAKVEWDAADRRVTIRSGEDRCELQVGSSVARVNDRIVTVDPAPILVECRVAVPVRFVEQALGTRVVWDDRTRAVHLFSGGPVVEEPRATLAFAGDVLLGFGMVGTLLEQHGVHYPWQGVRAVFTGADYAMVNLECAISTRGQPQAGKQWTFRGKPETLEGMRAGGIDIVNLANNHTLDYGMDAFLDTLDHLDAHGIARVGAGRNLTEALRPHVWEKDGLKVGFLGATAIYPSGWDATSTRAGVLVTHYESQVMKAVRELRQQVDIVVVCVHWGVERDGNADAYQRRYGRALVDNGAHVVIGHHPHVLQGIEIYKGAVIAYSLGNFIFTYNGIADTQDSAILLVTVEPGGVTDVQLLPVKAEVGRPRLLDGSDARRITQKVADRSRDWGTKLDEEGRVISP